MTRHACYAGSFDPPTFGHLDVIRRAAAIFEHLVVAVGRNAAKDSMLPLDVRVALLAAEAAKIRASVEVVAFDGLVTRFCEERGIGVLVRGLRGSSDFDGEMVMALANRRLSPAIETVALFASPENLMLSSRLVKEIALGKGPLERFVPESVAAELTRTLGRKEPAR